MSHRATAESEDTSSQSLQTIVTTQRSISTHRALPSSSNSTSTVMNNVNDLPLSDELHVSRTAMTSGEANTLPSRETGNTQLQPSCVNLEKKTKSSKNGQRQTPRKIAKNVRGNIAMIVPRGHKLRDEFVCPITRELITEPVIAADGHTYDRSAIERWLHSHTSSPKTGEPLEHLHLVPNHNLKRLLRDMLREGGQALYCLESDGIIERTRTQNCNLEKNLSLAYPDIDINLSDSCGDDGPRLALVRELVLTCRCLGPVESDWIGRSFRVTESGAVGGRRRPNETTEGSEFIQFTDATVSRKHFEIVFNREEHQYCLRDLGSAGGTFIRIPPGSPRPITPGMMIMLGKHQLIASSAPPSPSQLTENMNIDEEPDVHCCTMNGEDNTTPTGNTGDGARRRFSHPSYAYCRSLTISPKWDDSALEEAVAATDVNTPTYGEVDAVLRAATKGYLEHNQGDEEDIIDSDCVNEDVAPGHDSRVNVQESGEEIDVVASPSRIRESGIVGGDGMSSAVPLERQQTTQLAPLGTQFSFQAKPTQHQHQTSEQVNDDDACHDTCAPPLLMLRCFAPEGTPIQGHEYSVGKEGASLGRRAGNSISFSHRVDDAFVGIDSSISGEHASINYNQDTGMLELSDGVKSKVKGSTNGTWVRLSAMHAESNSYPLVDKTEVLIGTVRFLISIDEVVVERDIYE